MPNKPFSQNTNITSLETFQNQFLAKPPGSQAESGQGRGVASGDQSRAGSLRVECGHCSGDREPLTRPAALIRHGQAWRREEREESEGTNPGDEAAAAAKGEPSAAPAGASPARLIVNSHMINLSA